MTLMIIALIIMLVCMAMGTHAAIAMGLVTTGLVLFLDGVPTVVIAQTAFKSVNSYPLMAIPMFVLAGNFMMKGQIAELILDLVGSVVRAVRGGMALTAMLASIFFAAVSGSSVGAAAAIGSSTVEGLKREKYPTNFSAAIVAVGGTLGLMIPPSLGFILIGSIVGLPVDKLFVAGVLPGLLEALLLTITVVAISRRRGYGNKVLKADWGTFSRRLPKAGAAIMMPVLVLGAIYTGYLTPTEVSAFAAVYAAFLCLFVYRSVNVSGIWDATRESMLQTAMIFAVVMGGSLIGFVLARMGVSAALVDGITAMNISAFEFLLIVNLVLLLLGMFLDGVSLIVLTAPLLFPVATAMGVDPIHFAVIMVANVEIATLTPPIGLNLFVMSGIARIPIHEVMKGVMPFYVTRLIGLAIITYVPAVSLLLI